MDNKWIWRKSEESTNYFELKSVEVEAIWSCFLVHGSSLAVVFWIHWKRHLISPAVLQLSLQMGSYGSLLPRLGIFCTLKELYEMLFCICWLSTVFCCIKKICLLCAFVV